MDYFNKIYKILLHLLIGICLISFWGAFVYRLYSLNNYGIAISLILAISSYFIIQRFRPPNNTSRLEAILNNIKSRASELKTSKKNSFYKLILFISYAIPAIFCFYVLFSSATDISIVSPWEVVPRYFFVFYTISTLALVINIIKNKNISIYLIIFHYLLSFSIALIVYKIGYGFDPFIHEATIDLINKTGSVDPKPFYYLGQYSFIVILCKITSISPVLLDKILVPLLSAIFLPLIIWKVSQKIFSDSRASQLAVLFILILPFSFFIVTTPQSFAYLLLLLAILLGLICSCLFDLIIIYLFALTAIAIQPIAGIPALLFALALTIYHSENPKLKKIGYPTISLVSIFSLPASFYFVEKIFSANANVGLNTDAVLSGFSLFSKFTIPADENFILNAIYLYGFNIKSVFLALLIIGAYIAYRHREQCDKFKIYLLLSLSFFASFLIAKIIPFNFLIDYERDNYTDRIIIIGLLFLVPFFITVIYGLVEKIFKSDKFIKFSFLAFFALLITASLYLSYPRHDKYFNSRGFSTGKYDIEAVQWIENNTQKNYIVLANQQVSAAALKEYGFSRYYKNNIFYYPIPTGGPLYQYFLDMVYKRPSQETMHKAMELAGADEGYFILNKYWWAFPKILDEAKFEAEAWKEIGNGEVYVFKY